MTNFMSSNNGLAHKGDFVEAFKASMGLSSNTNTQKLNVRKERTTSNLDLINSNSVLDTFALLDVEINGEGGFNYYINKEEEKQEKTGFLSKLFKSFST